MIGEVRDMESMVLASEAALTGHLVLTQTSIPNAATIPQHMVAFGVEPWIVAQTLIGVIATRLVRKICPDCMEEYTPSQETLQFLGLQDVVNNTKFYRGRGCERCRNTGYLGRDQLHEILVIDRNLAKMIAKGQVLQEDIRLRDREPGGVTSASEAPGGAFCFGNAG
jgi:type II secretory ATPase GspE/PulE/Tfp pilus assembly ATPase PilB-like protein